MNMIKPLVGAVAVAISSGLMFSQVANAQEEERVGLEEVIVTAQKREESFTDVPVAVSAFSGEVLDMAKISEFQDLVQISPSMTFNQTGDQRGVGVLIRGIGTTAFQTAVEPTVSSIVDGVTLGRTVQFVSDLNDIERVEILRGPQGTLFGKNASGGVINVITKRPSETFEGSVKAEIANDSAWSVSAGVSGPVSENARARVSMYKKEYDGWAKNLYSGNDINGDNSWGIRGKLDIDLSENTNLYLIADYSKQDRNCCSFIYTNSTSPYYLWDYAQYGISLTENWENNKTIDAEDGFSDTETWGMSAELNTELNDSWMLTSITGFRGFTLQTNQGVDGLPYNTPTYGRFLFTSNGAYNGGDQQQDQFSEELRLTYTGSDKLDFQGGLFYWKQTVDRYFERESYLCVAPGAGLDPDPSVTPCAVALHGKGYFDSSVETKSWAAFAQADFHVTDKLTASLGARYTNDDLSLNFSRTTELPGPAVAPSEPYYATGTTENKLTGKFALSYDINDEVMVYTSYATGYKSPAYDLIFGSTAARLQNPVAPETSKAWEAGMKGEFFDNRLRMSVTAFHTDFENLQSQTTPPDGIGFALESAGVATTKGLELEVTAKPTANLLLNGGVAFVDAYYSDYDAAPCYGGQTADLGCVGGIQNLTGKQINNAPKVKGAFQARYDIQLDGAMDMFLSSTYRWQSGSPGALDHNPRVANVAYDVLDLMIGFEADDGSWSANIFAKNALDDFYADMTTFALGNDATYLTRDAHRYIGASVEYRFGDK